MPNRQPPESTTPARAVYSRIKEILKSAAHDGRSGRGNHILANWLIGREVLEQRRRRKKNAEYGAALLMRLSAYLRSQFGRGYSVDNLEWYQIFYAAYPDLLGIEKSDAARRILTETPSIAQTPRDQSWQPGQIHPKLTWTHYRALSRLEDAEARAFYEREAVGRNWPARELERQIKSRLNEQSAVKKGKNRPSRRMSTGPATRPRDAVEDPAFKPCYDRDLRELWVDGLCLHRFRSHACNVTAVLEKLQAEGWPRKVFDPLGKTMNKKYGGWLKTAVCRLKQCQKPALIDFHSHPKDRAVSWEFRLP